MKKVVRLTESDLQRIVKRIIKEEMGGMEDTHPIYGDINFGKMSREDILNLDKMGSSEYSEEYDEDFDDIDDLEFERERRRRLRNRMSENSKKLKRK
jgi:hypothetical protein